MSDHYYTENPGVESEEREWSFTLRGETFSFCSDRGVFSKKEVDFGSRLLIEVFRLPDINGPILDIGCGYGPIGLALAKDDGGRIVHMVDVNERALELSRRNAEKNNISNIIVYKSDRLEEVVEKQFAAIVTNPPIRAGKQVVHSIFEQAFEHLADKGELWVVIQKKQGAPSAIEKLKSHFNEVEVVEKKKGYFIIKAKKI
ncbi:class I SAM-dependent methyltransferase [Halalkalibacter krulwichiae]|uniref:Ribosomal RNA small subunit methyltransferase C n=1 Tax=Halalkalibacter krulwichiae TaxID=199441 RepID=A0A1X9M743_9BACI|nr:class I SAM-dependent methyltransferase [Halalkalibacter krulwichiae]ARK28504.1 Ribosomal RNA small subunit methyltransferase C [Halalkalibacter krulwichiae]